MAVINLYSFYQAISAGLCLAIQGSSALKQGISCKTIGRVRKTMVCVHRDFFQNTCMQRANQSLEQPQGVVYLPNNPTHPIIARQSPPEHSPAHPSTAHWDNSIGHGGSYMAVIGYKGLHQGYMIQSRLGWGYWVVIRLLEAVPVSCWPCTCLCFERNPRVHRPWFCVHGQQFYRGMSKLQCITVLVLPNRVQQRTAEPTRAL